MNPLTQIKNTQKASKYEIAQGFSESASWHARFKHSAYIFAGGLPFDLTEGDLLAIFAQYGELVDINLVKDKDTGAQCSCSCQMPSSPRARKAHPRIRQSAVLAA
jgi:RNA-binding motif protein, X-linked 2